MWVRLLMAIVREIKKRNKSIICYIIINLKSATPFPKCYLHKEKWTFDS